MDPVEFLPLRLPGRGTRQRLAALHEQLRAAILDGRLRPGVALPSTRTLAAAHGLARNTVVAAYDRLLAEGYLESRPGAATRVAAAVPAHPRVPARAGSRLDARWRGSPSPRRGPMPTAAFRVGLADAAAFPHALWRRLVAAESRRAQRAPFVDDPQGLAPLREAIAGHVSYTRAVACGAEDVLVTAGAQQAFDLLARVLVTPGRTRVALEDPGYPPLRQVLLAAGARLQGVAVDDDGIVVGRIGRDARVVCVTPSHQFPLGAVLSAQRRAELLAHCAARGAVVIEDDYDGEFRFASRPLDALQTIDRDGLVIYVGTFSKSLSPDLRVGYIVAPPWAMRALVAARTVAGGQGRTVEQSALARLIREGHLARHVRRMQRRYGERRERLLAALADRFGGRLHVLPALAGLHVTARLVGAPGESAVVERAATAGLALAGLGPCWHGRPAFAGLMLGYGNVELEEIDAGLDRLGEALRRR